MTQQQNRQPLGLSVEPLFLQQKDIPASVSVRSLDISLEASKAVGREHFLGSQNVRGIWRLYTKSREKRLELLTKGISLQGKSIPIYEANPRVTNVDNPSVQVEKVVIKDLPISISNDEVKAFLQNKGLNLTSEPRYSKDRDEDGKLTSFLNGDRYVYAIAPISPVVPPNAVIADQKCRVYHPSQKNLCKVCNISGHKTKDPSCPAYTPAQDIVTVVSYQNPLSNMYMGEGIDHEGIHYKSIEHAYQCSKASHAGLTDLEKQIKNAKHAGIAKALSHDIPKSESWDNMRVDTMKEMLTTKAVDDPVFRDALLETGQKVIAHTVRDDFWGTGFSPELTRVTRSTHWEKNMMGNLLMELRAEICDAMTKSASQCQIPIAEEESDLASHLTTGDVDEQADEPSVISGAAVVDDTHSTQVRGRSMLREEGRNASPSPARNRRSRPLSRASRSKSVSVCATPTTIDAFLSKRKPSGTPPDANVLKQSKIDKSDAHEQSPG